MLIVVCITYIHTDIREFNLYNKTITYTFVLHTIKYKLFGYQQFIHFEQNVENMNNNF